MFILLYRFLINLVFIISPIIILIRIFKNKEDIKRFKEKFCFFSQKRNKNNLIWFHGASVGELLSVIPLIEKLEKEKNIHQILITTSTLSSSKVFEKFKFKKTIHQFFPIDTNFLSKKFLNFWKPSIAVFIDSEIWPNMLLNLKNKSISTILLNARITKKSFDRWNTLNNFSKEIFNCFTKTLPCNKETFSYLKKFGLKNINIIGNLKFAQNSTTLSRPSKKLKKFFANKTYWCASSTHDSEELFCLKVHLSLKKKFNNLVTIIIPRHINRDEDLKNTFKNYNLKFHCHSWSKKIENDIDIYLVDTYGDTNIFFNFNKIVFVGGSIVKHGGQNPLEPIRNGCNVIHGPNVDNFREIYKLLKKLKISNQIKSEKSLEKNIIKYLKRKSEPKLVINKVKKIGKNILEKTLKEVKQELK